MKKNYVLDACALLAYFYDETGADFMQNTFDSAKRNELALSMHALNLFEVYYDVCKAHGENKAKNILKSVKKFPMAINYKIDEDMMIKAGVLKSKYKISLADAIGLAQTILLNASFITCDHHELDVVQTKENVNFVWLR
jgi:predicted nucleic acid-binding protein